MNILIITPSNPNVSAGVVASDLYGALSAIDGNNVLIFTKNYDRTLGAHVTSYYNKRQQMVWNIKRRLENVKKRVQKIVNLFPNKLTSIFFNNQSKNINYAFHDYDMKREYVSTDKILRKIDFIPDVIIVLFLDKFITYKNIYELSKQSGAPVFMYMMDMALLTGGCHYAWDCQGYLNKCGNCPALYSKNNEDQSRVNWEYKQEYISKTNIIAVAPTQYVYKQLCVSSLFKKKIKEKVLLGIDSDKYKPFDKLAARKTLGLPLGKKVLFFGAGNVKNRRKGFRELLKSLEIVNENEIKYDIHIAIAGHVDVNAEFYLPFEYTCLGKLTHEKLPLAYQAADMFLCPSIEDSGPMMINQAVMSGLPVVAFDMGVAFDLVVTGKTGYRGKLGDCDDFADGIKYILDLSYEEYSLMRRNCRQLALESYDTPVQGINFYNILNNSRLK